MGRHPCCPPSPEHGFDPGALFDEAEMVGFLKVNPTLSNPSTWRLLHDKKVSRPVAIIAVV